MSDEMSLYQIKVTYMGDDQVHEAVVWEGGQYEVLLRHQLIELQCSQRDSDFLRWHDPETDVRHSIRTGSVLRIESGPVDTIATPPLEAAEAPVPKESFLSDIPHEFQPNVPLTFGNRQPVR